MGLTRSITGGVDASVLIDAALDALTPEDIGAETPDGAAALITAHSADPAAHPAKSTSTAGDPITSSDITAGYSPGSKWTNTSDSSVYWCMDSTAGAAVWIREQAGLWTGYAKVREMWFRRIMRRDSRYVPPSIEAVKLAAPIPFQERARVISGDVRVISIGNSYRTLPLPQLEKAFVSRANRNGIFSASEVPINAAGWSASSGGARNTDPTLSLVPQQGGHNIIPDGGSFSTKQGLGTGYIIGYVQQPGAGTLSIEVSNDNGSTWTFFTDSVDCDGALAYLSLSETGWTKRGYNIRLSASGGPVEIGLVCVTGALSHLPVTTGSSAPGGYAQWSDSILIRESVEAWWGAYDADLVFVRYSDDQAIDPEWSRFVSILTAACPNAQIIMVGEHDNGYFTGRDAVDGGHIIRNDSLREACKDLPNFSFVDVWNWLPKFQDAYDVGTMTSPDDVHLNAAGDAVVNACVWEALQPWLFTDPGIPAARNDIRARQIFETSGWAQTQVLTDDVSVADDADTTNGPALFTWSGLDPVGWYELEWMISVTSNSTVRARFGLNVVTSKVFDSVRAGGYFNASGVYTNQPPPTNKSGVSMASTAFSGGGSTVLWTAKQSFKINGTASEIVRLPGMVQIFAAQHNSNATPVVFGRGSTATLRKINAGGAKADHLIGLP